MKKGFHTLYSRRTDTRQQLVTMHGIAARYTQPELAFDPENQLSTVRKLSNNSTNYMYIIDGWKTPNLPADENYGPCRSYNTLGAHTSQP